MCGIAAILGESTHKERCLEEMLAAIAHRGAAPFLNEVKFGSGFALGCNRLPFTSGHEPQPARSPSGRYFVLLNGEIYDFHKHRRPNLRRSDTAALAIAIEHKGIDVLCELDGIFACIVYDTELKVLHLSRDRFGVKPLYYARRNSSIACASEIKALVSLNRLLTIEEVEPGTIVSFAEGRPQAASLKSFPTLKNHHQSDLPSDIVATLAEAIKEAVLAQSSDDQTYGVFLSGGVDSTGIYSILEEQGRRVVPLVLGSPTSTDVLAAKRFMDTRGTAAKLHIFPCPSEERLFDTVHTTIRMVESFEPNVVRQSTISRLIAQGAASLGLSVAFCGEGADELFGGYPEFAATPNFAQLRARFLKDLYRTQLQRVDRTAMAETIEVRVPYLAKEVAALALSTDHRDYFIVKDEVGVIHNKVILRAALRQVTNLSNEVLDRPKAVLSEGAGVRGNDLQAGMFSGLVDEALSDHEADSIIRANPEFSLKSKEEAFYFQIFKSYSYDKCQSARSRVFANAKHSLQSIGRDLVKGSSFNN